MSKSLEKGNALERAVTAIENLILRSSPNIKEGSFKIESKKILVIDGVRHEIDLYVSVDAGSDYKSIFIFECKNWTDAVNKNEIIVFSEKISSSQAQKGFFVAKSFTGDAINQAKKDPRIQLLLTTEHNAEATEAPFLFHVVNKLRDSFNATATFYERGASKDKSRAEYDIETADAKLDGKAINLRDDFMRWCDEISDQDLSKTPSQTMPEGEYEREINSERDFHANQLLINDIDVEKITLNLKYKFQVLRPAVEYNFDVHGRGKAISLKPVKIGDGEMRVQFISRR